MWSTVFASARDSLLTLTGPVASLVGLGFALTVCAGVGAVLGGEWDRPEAEPAGGEPA